jgi:hypothetical protein
MRVGGLLGVYVAGYCLGSLSSIYNDSQGVGSTADAILSISQSLVLFNEGSWVGL